MSQLRRLIKSWLDFVLALSQNKVHRLRLKSNARLVTSNARLVTSNIMPVFWISFFTTRSFCLNRHLHGKLSLLTEPFARARQSGWLGHWSVLTNPKFSQQKRHRLVLVKNTALQRSGDVLLLLPYLHLQSSDQQQQLSSATPPSFNLPSMNY